MNNDQIITSILVNLATGALFFILGWLLARNTNFKIRELWYVNNIRRARKLYEIGRIDKSLEEYTHTTENIDENIWFKNNDFINLAQIYLKKRNVSKCILYLNKIVDKNIYQSPKHKVAFGVLLMNNSYYSEAKKILLYGEQGDDSEWHSMLAWAFSLNNDFELAAKECEIASKKAPLINAENTYLRCGLAYMNIKLLNKAHKCFKSCLSSFNPEIKMWAYNNIGLICEKIQRERVRKGNFRNVKRFKMLAHNFYWQAYDILKREKLGEIAIDPSLVVANLISYTRDREKKSDYIELGLEIAPESARLRTQIAWLYYDCGDYKNALMNAKKAYNINHEDILCLEVLAASYLKNKQYDYVIKIADEAWKINHYITDAGGYINALAAEAKEYLGMKGEALNDYMVAITKGFNEIPHYEYFYEKAIGLANWLGDFNKSNFLCKEALLIFPENKKIKELLGKIIKESGTTEIYKFNPFRTI